MAALPETSDLNYPAYDCATTKAALRVGRIKSRGDADALAALDAALSSPDACATIGLWAQDKLAEQQASGASAAGGGGWLAIFQLILQNLPTIIAIIESLINPTPPKPVPTP